MSCSVVRSCGFDITSTGLSCRMTDPLCICYVAKAPRPFRWGDALRVKDASWGMYRLWYAGYRDKQFVAHLYEDSLL